MQFTVFFATLAAVAAVVVAAPHHTAGQCNVGEVQCCNQITKGDDPEIFGLLNQVGIILDDATVAVGVECNPITGIGAGAGSCNIEPVCCENNSFGSLIALGCVPVNVA